MADNVTLDAGSGGATIATDDNGTAHVQWVKLQFGGDGTFTSVTASTGLPVGDAGGSLTVDAPVGTPVFVRLSDGSSAISTLPVSLASVPSHAVTNAGTFVVQVDGSALSALQLLDDVVLTDDAAFTPASSKVAMVGAQFDDTTPDSVDEGDAGALRMSGRRELYVQIRDAAGNERGLNIDASGNLGVGTHAVTQSGTWNVGTVTAVTSITNTVTVTGAGGTFPVTDSGGSLTVDAPVGTPVFVRLSDGSSAISTLPVSLASVPSHAVTNAGTFAVQVDGAALTALQLIDDVVATEDAAHGSGDKGVMALAVRRDADTTLADTTGDYAPLQVDATGALKVAIISGAGSGGTAATDDAAFTAGTTSFTPVGGIVTADSVDSGDGGAFAMLANRQQKVTLYDSSGVELAVGGGTQYTEDAAAAANPTGTALIMVRADSLAGVTTADGDNVAARGTDKGELYVKHADTIAATQSGTWNVGTVTTVTTCSTVTNVATIGTSVTPGTAAGHLGKAEDAAHSSGDTGVFVLAVRSDTAASTGQSDGDYTALVTDSTGRLHVNVGNTVTVASHAVTNAGTFAVQVDGAALTALQLIDDVVYTDDADFVDDTSKFALVGGVYQATPQTITDGDVGPVLLDANGRVQVATHAVTQSGTWNVGTVTTVTTCATVTSLSQFAGQAIDLGGGATGAGTLRVTIASDSTGVLSVDDNGAALTVDNAGTFAVQVDGSALTALQLIDDPVFADDAAFTVGTSKVMVAGGIVDDDSTDAADEGDAVAFRATKERKQRVVAALDSEYMQAGNDQVTPKFAVIDAATSGDNTLVAAVASKKIRVLSLYLVSSGTVTVRFESGASGTALSGQMNLVANSGFVLPFSPVGHFETATNTLLNLELSGATSVDGGLTYIECD